jgi:hypothetical protein
MFFLINQRTIFLAMTFSDQMGTDEPRTEARLRDFADEDALGEGNRVAAHERV